MNNCEHELVYFVSSYYKRLMYIPKFVCLNCGKEINGILNENQACVNKEDMNNDYDNIRELNITKYYYHELKYEGLSIKEIKDRLNEKTKVKAKNRSL